MKMLSEKRAIDKIFRRRDRYDIPDWQRQEVWNREKKQRLIDSILRGWKLPKFYFIEESEKTTSSKTGNSVSMQSGNFFRMSSRSVRSRLSSSAAGITEISRALSRMLSTISR